MNFNFTKYSIIYYILFFVLTGGSILALLMFGLKFGIEFTGGSVMEIQFENSRPANDQIQSVLSELLIGEIVIQPAESNGLILKFKGVDGTTHQQIIDKLSKLSKAQEISFEYIGPSIGQELKQKTILSMFLALLAITLYIAFAFRKVSKPVSSFKYGITSLVALFHDILIPLGVFAILGKFYDVEITIPIIAALLTVLGFSVHDTIVIFDRIRENILRGGMGRFEDTVNWSLNQTFGRSISTVFTTLLVLFSIFFFGGQTLKYFSLALIIGITSGAYSSIFIAGPLLVSWQKWRA